jgi:general secretion pathway protein D
VGLTLNVEPNIYLNNEVGIKISLEVSNVLGQVTSTNGSVGYHIGTRQASTLLQLKDGENQVLAGLIDSEERNSALKVPLVGDLPILGRLFGTTTDDNTQSEIVLSITPHLVRTVQRPETSASEFTAGTEASFRRRPDGTPRLPALPPAPTPAPAPALTPVSTPAPMLPTPAQQMPAPAAAPTVPAGAVQPIVQPILQPATTAQ